MKALLDLSHQQLSDLVVELGQPKFRAKQLREWMVQKYYSDFSKMSNLSLEFRSTLSEKYQAYPLTINQIQQSSLDNTIKFTAQTTDNELIEVVVLKYDYGYSVCLSTQIGCAMGCAFCASAKGGLVRNCTTSEMLAQLLLAEQIVNTRIGRIVLMGMGEPLNNYDQVVNFLKICNDPVWGPGISMRHLTLSSCGLVPQIRKLADEKLPITLAISLHAPNDYIRQQIIPIAAKYPIAELMEACKYYFQQTDRRISFEYTLIKDLNDSIQCAEELVELLRKEHMHINIIPYNSVDFLNWESPQKQQVDLFAKTLRQAGLSVTVRRRLGDDIDAACGQLRRRLQKSEV